MGGAERIPRRRLCETDLPAARSPIARRQENSMNVLKHIRLTLGQLVQRVRLWSQNIAAVFQQRRQRAVRNELEVERLDRIRNPAKYRGK